MHTITQMNCTTQNETVPKFIACNFSFSTELQSQADSGYAASSTCTLSGTLSSCPLACIVY